VITLRTARLTLQPVELADERRLLEFVNQPGVRRFLFDDKATSPEAVRDIIDTSRVCFEENRFGLWLGSADDRLIGFSAIWFLRETRDRELMYAVGDAHVRQGYGRELAQAVLDYVFDTLGWDVVEASADVPNAASRRLLDALGFRLTRQATVSGLDTAFYALRAQDYAPSGGR
jgi:ribosomal-protein-alanine N-acetyltransferase